MIDWGLVLFPIVHKPINSGQVTSTTPDGEIEWCSPKRVQATGSFEKKVSIRGLVHKREIFRLLPYRSL